jgi:hypothetical protein
MKRLVAGPLWFLSVWYLFELLAVLFGVPRILGPIVAAVVAGGVWLDPMHWFWAAPSHKVPANGQPSTGLQPSATLPSQ